jgi:selenocysteine lyase/cysteine desulfurase
MPRGRWFCKRAADDEANARVDYSSNVDAPPQWESKKNEEAILEGRRAVGDLLNAPDPNCIVSGESATSLLFHLSYAIGKELYGRRT